MASLNVMKNLRPAKRYADALMKFSSGDSYLQLCEDLEFVSNNILKNDELREFLFAPIVSKSDKNDALRQIFLGKISEPVLNFLFLLVENNRVSILNDVLLCFKQDIDKVQNVLRADIFSAVELNSDEREALLSKLKIKAKMEVLADFRVDETLLGGIVIKINDTVIDLSLKKRLKNLKEVIER